MVNQSSFEVLSPWAEAEAVAPRGITRRVADLSGKKIGLFHNGKKSAEPILDAVESQIREKIPGVEFSRFGNNVPNQPVIESASRAKFEDWIKSVDAVVAAVGD